jgi:hypothetical protein
VAQPTVLSYSAQFTVLSHSTEFTVLSPLLIELRSVQRHHGTWSYSAQFHSTEFTVLSLQCLITVIELAPEAAALSFTAFSPQCPVTAPITAFCHSTSASTESQPAQYRVTALSHYSTELQHQFTVSVSSHLLMHRLQCSAMFSHSTSYSDYAMLPVCQQLELQCPVMPSHGTSVTTSLQHLVTGPVTN